MAITINRLESQVQAKLPFQHELNPKNVSAMTLRSDKKVQGPEPVIPKDKNEKKIESKLEKEGSNGKNSVVLPDPIVEVKTHLPPFPSMLERSKKQNKEKEILEVFRKEVFETVGRDELEVVLTKHLELETTPEVEWSEDLKCIIGGLHLLPTTTKRYEHAPIFIPEPHQRVLSSVVQAPVLELKSLPKHLKYAYLDDNETLPVIISAILSEIQEEKLIRVLREHEKAIGWTIIDIKGISPSICMDRIRLEKDAKPIRQAQRRFNPLMMEVAKKEILKLLDVGIIFAISNSLWVSSVQIVPKKAGVTVEANQTGEFIPMRKPTGWRQCNDYRRLNAVTKKDHFFLPFIDQMVEHLACRAYYCFLDGFSGYFQIVIAPED
ncbi:uncharacterized protein LOC113773910 [Coffea eugenioides]|uniref:uncharacterized protein LOC113773910 n=1 Tax=Coffea eugenioides TaxID=49369 RepID=UPI000F610A91|nr:uncharacterized protein LOC113773910 [Coffea eugenioides]